MASGLPVITATSAGGAELVTPESGFVLSDSDDVEGLAIALSTLALDTELRTKMSQAAHMVAEQNTWHSKAQSYINLFEELVNNKQHRSLPSVKQPVMLKGA